VERAASAAAVLPWRGEVADPGRVRLWLPCRAVHAIYPVWGANETTR
jgi:hypothetical protein